MSGVSTPTIIVPTTESTPDMPGVQPTNAAQVR